MSDQTWSRVLKLNLLWRSRIQHHSQQAIRMQLRSLELSLKPETHEDHTVLTLCPPSGVHSSLPFPSPCGRVRPGEEETRRWGTGSRASGDGEKEAGVHETMKAIYTEAASRISVSFSNQHSPETNHSVCTPGGAGVLCIYSFFMKCHTLHLP